MDILDAIIHIDRYLDTIVATYGPAVYAVLFAIVFCEMAFLVLFFLPGDPLLFICGALCASGTINIWLLMALLFAAAVSGSVVNYRLGSLARRKVLDRGGLGLDRSALARTHAFYERHGSVTFLLSPFLAVVRTFAPFVAGVSAMSFDRFRLFMAAGIALWVLTLVPAGYFFGHIPFIREHLNTIVLTGAAIGVGALLMSASWRLARGLFAK
jgi:membrane-associated protein